MFCHQARKRLDEANWSYDIYSQDSELLEHLKNCRQCYSLVLAEAGLRDDLGSLKMLEPPGELSLDAIREKAESVGYQSADGEHIRKSFSGRLISLLLPVTRQKLAFGSITMVLLIVALFPFNFREVIGYQIAIDGVEKDIAVDNQKITSLLGALGMEKDKATTVADSLGVSQVRLSLGQCTETCRLTISDLKTEHDVRLMVKAIIELGCCHIDDIVPIFRNESTSLLRLAARKLLS